MSERHFYETRMMFMLALEEKLGPELAWLTTQTSETLPTNLEQMKTPQLYLYNFKEQISALELSIRNSN